LPRILGVSYNTARCASAGNAIQPYIWPSSPSPAGLSAGATSLVLKRVLRAKDTQFERNHDQASPDSLVFDRTSAQMALTLTLVVAQ
jgi:hypothetical protein